MRNIEKQTQSIQLSIYCNIILQTLYSHGEMSICKILVFSYLIKQQKFLGGNIYTAKTTQDVVYKCLSLLAGDFDGFCNSVSYILKAIHILANNNMVLITNNVLKLNIPNLQIEKVYEETNFMKKAIEESKFMTDRQFMKEVTYNV